MKSRWSTRLIAQIIAAGLGLWLADRYLSAVEIQGGWELFLKAAVVIGCLNFFIRPILKIISLPIRILTLGLFSVIIDMLMIWGATYLYPALVIPWFWPLFWTSILIGLSTAVISFILK